MMLEKCYSASPDKSSCECLRFAKSFTPTDFRQKRRSLRPVLDFCCRSWHARHFHRAQFTLRSRDVYCRLCRCCCCNWLLSRQHSNTRTDQLASMGRSVWNSLRHLHPHSCGGCSGSPCCGATRWSFRERLPHRQRLRMVRVDLCLFFSRVCICRHSSSKLPPIQIDRSQC